jgi:DNA gyrase subunit B
MKTVAFIRREVVTGKHDIFDLNVNPSNSFKVLGMGVSNSGGLHGVGASVVNALSLWVNVTIKREGIVWFREYKNGVPTSANLAEIGKCPKKETGTTVQFMPDKKYFRDAVFDDVRVRRRLRELSFLNPGLKVDLKWSDGSTESFHSEGGLKEYVSYLLGKKTKLCEPVCFNEKTDQFEAFCAFVYDSGFDETTLSFANNINTVEGGVHMNAALDSLCKELTTVADNAGLFKNLGDLKPLKSDVCEGLTLIVSVRVPEPSFGGQTKTKLANDELRKPMGDWFASKFADVFAKDKNIAKAIASKLVDSMKARDAARKAKNLSRKKSVLESMSLPGKLSDCSSKDPTMNELFIVEGDSAGGCLDPNALIKTCFGDKLISDINPQTDFVVDHDGVYRRVLNKWETYKRRKVQLRVGSEDLPVCSWDHPWLILREGKLLWVKATDVRDGDLVARLKDE